MLQEPVVQPVCCYCLAAPAITDDHVVARQFFPRDQRWRGNLPQVRSCFTCNQEKSTVEDIAGVVLQFGDASAGARAVLAERISRTLARNQKLHRELKAGYRPRVVVRMEDGTRRPGVGVELNERHLQALALWHRFLVRGFYMHEARCPLPADQEIRLVKPVLKEHYLLLRDAIMSDPEHHVRSLGDGEFRYMYAISRRDPVSMWLFAFRSVEMAAVTLGPGCSGELRAYLDKAEWKTARTPGEPVSTAGP